MKLAALLAGCLIAAPLCAVEQVGLTITLTQEDDEECDAGGGCFLVPRAALEREIARQVKLAVQAAHAECRNRI